MANETENLDVKPATGEMGDSSSSTETSEQDANAGQSMSDFVKGEMAKLRQPDSEDQTESTETEVVKSEEEESDSKIESDKEAEASESDAEKVTEKKEDEKVEGEKEEPKTEEVKEQEAVPYERFQEVNERAKQSEAQLKAVETKVTSYDNIVEFCGRNNITPKQFNETLEFLAAFNSGDLEKVGPKIREWYEQVQSVNGEKLPPDIQAKVDAGLDLEVAQAWAKDRAKSQLVEKRSQKTVQEMQAEHLAEFERQMTNASKSWVDAKMTADPDFKQGTLKWDEVQDRFQALAHAKDARGGNVNPIRNPQEMTAMLERAYNDVNDRMKKRNGNKPLIKRPLSSLASSSNKNKTRFEDAGSLQEAVRIGMKERGHTFS